MHEEFFRDTLDGALQEFTRRPPRGEFTLVIEGCGPGSEPEITEVEIVEALQRAVRAGHTPSSAAKTVATELRVAKKRAYTLSLALESTQV